MCIHKHETKCTYTHEKHDCQVHNHIPSFIHNFRWGLRNKNIFPDQDPMVPRLLLDPSYRLSQHNAYVRTGMCPSTYITEINIYPRNHASIPLHI